MYKAIFLTILLSILFSISACSGDKKLNSAAESPSASPAASPKSNDEKNTPIEYKSMAQDEAYTLLNSGSNITLLDVRSEDEFNSGHIPGAVLLPDYEVKDRALETLLDKEATVLVYCRSGNRSRSAALELNSLGYTNVYDIGGIQSWKYEIE